ncbi:MAG: cyclase family protein [Clostridia bacterium]|nr:cyclase family protein [Clostridia bacterium]
MKLYDISQEVFDCQVYPGDPAPERRILSQMERGELYNLSAFSMCAHNGTHVDAPYHFLQSGATVDQMPLSHFVGPAYVAEGEGVMDAAGACAVLEQARSAGAAERILLRGNVEITTAAAAVFAKAPLALLGVESQSVGPESAPMEVHRILLGAGVALLEGVRLQQVSAGVYFLCAAPLLLSGADGAPCRAILIEF